MNNRTKGISLAIITAVMWGIMGMFVRGLTGYAFTTFEISFFRCALAGGAYFLFLLFTKPSALKINLKGLVICLLYGAVAYSISFVSYSVAFPEFRWVWQLCCVYESDLGGNPGTVYVWRKTPKSKMVTILICLIGAVFVANLIGGGDIKHVGIGILAGVINGVGVALQILLPKYFAKDYERDTLLVYGFLGAAVVLMFGMDFGAVSSHMSSTPTRSVALEFIWNRNSVYHGGECILRQIYTICGSNYNQYPFCTGSCCRNSGRVCGIS